MFGLFKRKKPYEQQAWFVFETVQEQSRKSEFYADLSVPDTTEGRFDLLILHMFLVIERLKSEENGPEFSQNLFDVAFQSIDQGFREIGIGDMGVPKRMRKLMLGFNGRVHIYDEALSENDTDKLKHALERNVYFSLVERPENLDNTLDKLAEYVQINLQYLQGQSADAIMGGTIKFKDLNEV